MKNATTTATGDRTRVRQTQGPNKVSSNVGVSQCVTQVLHCVGVSACQRGKMADSLLRPSSVAEGSSAMPVVSRRAAILGHAL